MTLWDLQFYDSHTHTPQATEPIKQQYKPELYLKTATQKYKNSKNWKLQAVQQPDIS